ncbi:MAG: VanZ family protein [Planctomycetaceae bacterium]|nr:VanZ family protein [Planctomycetaceae bacterium]
MSSPVRDNSFNRQIIVRWRIATWSYLALVIYGSLVPLQYRPLDWDQAVDQFRSIPFLQLDIQHRADWVANILLFIPLSFLTYGLWIRPWYGQSRTVLTTLSLLVGLSALACTIEFTQQWFPPRTVSQNDIVAESLGGLIGCILWFLVGDQVRSWFSRGHQVFDSFRLVERILLVYTLAFAVYSVMPLDLIVSLEEIELKRAQGKIQFLPHLQWPQTIESWSAVLMQVFLFVPVGMYFVFAFARKSFRPVVRSSLLMMVGLAFGIELAQLFVYSRFSSANMLLLKMVGGVMGIVTARRLLIRRQRYHGKTKSLVPPRTIGGFTGYLLLNLLYASFLCGVFWWPLEAVDDNVAFQMRWNHFWQVPFTNYYWGTEFNALTQILQKLLLTMPMGYLFRATLQRCPVPQHQLAPLTACGTIMLAAFTIVIERGQAWYSGRYPDITDSLIYGLGMLTGAGIYQLLISQTFLENRSVSTSHSRVKTSETDIVRLD